MSHWALDLGTTNTGLARWNEEKQQPELVRLTNICRAPDTDEPLEAPRMVPSATHALEISGFLERLCTKPFLASRLFVGNWAHIGRPALELNQTSQHECYAKAFKQHLVTGPGKNSQYVVIR